MAMEEKSEMAYKDSQSYTKWDKENNVRMNIKLSKKSDSDILDFLSACGNKNGVIKNALRYYIASGCPEAMEKEEQVES